MNRVDFTTVLERLNALAEVYDRKAITQKAGDVWWQVLKSHVAADVLGVIDNWARTRAKWPTPADISSAAGEALSDRIEQNAAEDRRRERREIEQMGSTPHGREVLRLIRDFLAQPRDQDYHRHSKGVIEAYLADDCLYYVNPVTKERKPINGQTVTAQLARWHAEALRIPWAEVERWKREGLPPVWAAKAARVPGQDDEENTNADKATGSPRGAPGPESGARGALLEANE